MSKVDDYELRNMSQDLIDFKDQVTEIINFGKYQPQIVSDVPVFKGRGGEFIWVFAGGNSGAMFMCSTDQTTNWVSCFTFTL